MCQTDVLHAFLEQNQSSSIRSAVKHVDTAYFCHSPHIDVQNLLVMRALAVSGFYIFTFPLMSFFGMTTPATPPKSAPDLLLPGDPSISTSTDGGEIRPSI